MSERMAAQFCPYCGDTDLRPDERSHTAWECRSCARVFATRLLGISSRSTVANS